MNSTDIWKNKLTDRLVNSMEKHITKRLRYRMERLTDRQACENDGQIERQACEQDWKDKFIEKVRKRMERRDRHLKRIEDKVER